MTRDEITGRTLGDIDPEVFSAYERRVAPLVDQLSELMEDLSDEVMAEFDDPVKANDLFLMTCTHVVTLAVVSSQLRGTPMSVSRLCVAIARVLTEKGFFCDGELTTLTDDCRAVVVPLDDSAANANNGKEGNKK